METSLASFVSSFLQCVMGEPPTQPQIEMLMAVARRADFERLTRGDFVIPLTSPKLKEVADPATPFGRFLLNPTEENIKLIERCLGTCNLPVASIVLQNNKLQIHLDKAKVMKTFIPRIAKKGLRYGASKLLQQVPVLVSHCRAQNPDCSLKDMRGVKLANHLTRVLEFCGAKVNTGESQGAGAMTSKDEDFTVVSHEDCEPEAGRLMTLEPHSHLEQSTHRGTPVASAHYSVVNERQTESRQGDESRKKRPHIEEELNVPCGGHSEIESEVSDFSVEKIHVMCAPESHDTEMETQTQYKCVSERIEPSVKDEKTQVEREIHIPATQDPSDEQKDKLVSEVKFLITDSMKGVKDGPWVYQYAGVVNAHTGNPWTGSAQDYCRILVEELKRTSEMRHRDADGPEWMSSLEEQAQRCLTLQLLSPTHSNQLRVEVAGDTHNTKEVSFMLYNYARLCSILDHFEQCVRHGDVAPLPPAEDVDFSLLRNDEEWDLVWLYLLRWPEIVEEMAFGVLAKNKKPKTAQVSRFLYSLSHRWSEYYCRHQVLSEGFLPHLLPLMYARLHLLQALSTLMCTCFAILGVDSLPSHM